MPGKRISIADYIYCYRSWCSILDTEYNATNDQAFFLSLRPDETTIPISYRC